MDFQPASKTATKIEDFLVSRGWCIDGDLTRILEQANRKIERIQADAIRGIVSKLECYQQEATLWANNEMTDIEGNPDPISKREQAKSRTDVRHIKAAIARLRKGEIE